LYFAWAFVRSEFEFDWEGSQGGMRGWGGCCFLGLWRRVVMLGLGVRFLSRSAVLPPLLVLVLDRDREEDEAPSSLEKLSRVDATTLTVSVDVCVNGINAET